MKLLALGIVTALSFSANAAQLNYDFIEAGYIQTDIDAISIVDPKGFVLAGSKQVNDNWYMSGHYASQSDEVRDTVYFYDQSATITVDVDFTRFALGAGYIYSLSNETKIDYSVHLGQIEADVSGDSDSTDTLTLNAQVRHLVNPSFELSAGLGFERLHDDESENSAVVNAGAQYYFNNQFSVKAQYRNADEYSDILLVARYSF